MSEGSEVSDSRAGHTACLTADAPPGNDLFFIQSLFFLNAANSEQGCFFLNAANSKRVNKSKTETDTVTKPCGRNDSHII